MSRIDDIVKKLAKMDVIAKMSFKKGDMFVIENEGLNGFIVAVVTDGTNQFIKKKPHIHLVSFFFSPDEDMNGEECLRCKAEKKDKVKTFLDENGVYFISGLSGDFEKIYSNQRVSKLPHKLLGYVNFDGDSIDLFEKYVMGYGYTDGMDFNPVIDWEPSVDYLTVR